MTAFAKCGGTKESTVGSVMEKDYLVPKRASLSRSSGEWNDDDFDVLAEGVVEFSR